MPTVFAVALLAILGGVVATGWAKALERRAKQDGTYADGFVYVEEDGHIRELTADERAFLNREFEGADSGRPYIKTSYRARTPDGRMAGFIARSRARKWMKRLRG